MRDRNTLRRRSGWQDVSDAVRRVMQANQSKNTAPERKVRSLAHRLGYRYRTHVRSLPGTPDLVFAARRKVVWVHGCFWHGHQGCPLGTVPRTRTDYWLPKLTRNRIRDAEHTEALQAMGWRSLVIWECELRDAQAVEAKLCNFLGPPRLPERQPGRNSLPNAGRSSRNPKPDGAG